MSDTARPSPLPSPIQFGTDGVRGPAGAWPINADGARVIGRAVADHARISGPPGSRPKVAVLRDSRASGPALQEALVAGLVAGGADVLLGGVLPTAAASCLVRDLGLQAGVVLTASHNPWTDNGIKVLGPGGGKLTETAALEARFGCPSPVEEEGSVHVLDDPAGPWRAAMPRVDLSGRTLLLDAASGAAWAVGPALLESLGARVLRRDPAPDGQNINDGVGAMHPPTPAELAERGADLALCLDGDADRIVLVDPVSGELDGDDLLWLLSRQDPRPVVGTILSNGGLGAALGPRLLRAAVGDRHVAALMAASGAACGAEPSGHVLFDDGMPTGDGLYSALRVLQAVADAAGRPALPLPVGGWTRWPQAGQNLRFSGPRVSLEAWSSVIACEQSGARPVVRYSGTEAKLRIMVEGQGQGDEAPAAWVDRIAADFQARLAAR